MKMSMIKHLLLSLLVLFAACILAIPSAFAAKGGKVPPPSIESVLMIPGNPLACDSGTRDCDTINIKGSDLRNVNDAGDVPVVNLASLPSLSVIGDGTATEVIVELTPGGDPGEGTHRLHYASVGGSTAIDIALAATVSEQVCVDFDGDGVIIANGDCNDTDPNINSQAVELCDDIDNNCNFIVDIDAHPNLGQSCLSTGDGACVTEGIFVCSLDKTTTECDAVEGSPGIEICNGVDDDCDGVVDSGPGLCPIPPTGPNGCQFGVCLGETGCGVGFHPDGTACLTAAASAGVCQGGACQASCGVCYGGCEVDNDSDGRNECEGDCNDNNSDVGEPTELLCDGLDNDCNGQIDEHWDLNSDPDNCGFCGLECPERPNISSRSCEFGVCGFTCEAGFLDCNGFSEDGCEVNAGSCP